MIVPRDYQIEAVLSLPRYFAEYTGNPVIAMPTGTGKSVVIAMFLQYVFQYPGQKVVVATHVKELIQQNYEKLKLVWPNAPAGIYSAGLKQKDAHSPIVFAGIGSIAKKADQFGRVDILIIDEAHLLSPSDDTMYQKFIKALKTTNPALKVIGLTATPWRLGMGRITEGGLFTHICFDITGLNPFNRLLAEGYLCPLVPKNPSFTLNVEGVGTQAGEFKQDQLQLAVDKDEITRRALQEAVHYGQGRHSWIVFASGVDHAIHCAEVLNEFGITCGVVHSNMSDKERDDQIADWKAGKVQCIANNGILTTGVDHPALDFIIMLRPTKSTVLWLQMLGRGTRPMYVFGFDLMTTEGRLQSIAASQKQNCLVMDFAKNTERLGPVNDPVIPRKKGDKRGGEAPIKLCHSCATWNHASLRHCCVCGSEFPLFGPKIKDTAGTNALIKQDIPVTEVFDVTQITYQRHEKRATGQPSVKVSYYCGLKAFHEFVPVEGVGSARGIARRWWGARKLKGMPELPETVDATLELCNSLPVATHIRVWTNKQYPEIINHCFDGTKFGTQEPTAAPRVAIQTPPIRSPIARAAPASFDNMDDDIPF